MNKNRAYSPTNNKRFFSVRVTRFIANTWNVLPSHSYEMILKMILNRVYNNSLWLYISSKNVFFKKSY